MTLLIDVGNTRIKWALMRPAGVEPGGSAVYCGCAPEALLADWTQLSTPTAVWAVSVASAEVNAQLSLWVDAHWGLELRWLRSAALARGVINGYHQPERLGADRWAAIIGARARRPGSAVVVDSGSAVTIDAVDADGRHRGGVIFPGVSLMRRSLKQGTAQLPLVEDQGVTVFGRDTASAIASGTLLSVAYAVQALADQMAAELGARPSYWLTGGDAAALLPYLETRFEHAPHLVLEGLAFAARDIL